MTKITTITARVRAFMGLSGKGGLRKHEMERVLDVLQQQQRLIAALRRELEDKVQTHRYQAGPSVDADFLKALRRKLHTDRFTDLDTAKRRADEALQAINQRLN